MAGALAWTEQKITDDPLLMVDARFGHGRDGIWQVRGQAAGGDVRF
jgi:hypothetical protein